MQHLHSERQTVEWNLFARELKCMLALRGKTIYSICSSTDIPSEVARRLNRSIDTPKSFPVLNPRDLEEVALAFDFTQDERNRLRMAILATAIERILMDRLSQSDALSVTEHIFLLLLEHAPTLATQLQASTRHTREDENAVIALEPDIALNNAITLIERAWLIFYLAESALEITEQEALLHDAENAFSHALRMFEQIPPSDQDTDDRRFWRRQAEHGLTETQIFLNQIFAKS